MFQVNGTSRPTDSSHPSPGSHSSDPDHRARDEKAGLGSKFWKRSAHGSLLSTLALSLVARRIPAVSSSSTHSDIAGAIYCATKHAVAAFSSSLMKELVNTNIRVCEIQPGKHERDHG